MTKEKALSASLFETDQEEGEEWEKRAWYSLIPRDSLSLRGGEDHKEKKQQKKGWWKGSEGRREEKGYFEISKDGDRVLWSTKDVLLRSFSFSSPVIDVSIGEFFPSPSLRRCLCVLLSDSLDVVELDEGKHYTVALPSSSTLFERVWGLPVGVLLEGRNKWSMVPDFWRDDDFVQDHEWYLFISIFALLTLFLFFFFFFFFFFFTHSFPVVICGF